MIKEFAVKFIIFTLPMSMVIASYVVFDPFKVLYTYDDFYDKSYVNVNRDYISSRTFVNKYNKYHYNSFIFGSSRTEGFQTKDWVTHLDKSASPFAFDASSERITGIHSKLKFLDERNVDIKNALVLICSDVTFAKPQRMEGVLLSKDPEVEGEGRYLHFHQAFFSAYMHDYFFVRYLKFHLFHIRNDGGLLMDFIDLKADSVTNDLYILYREAELKEDSIAYYENKDFYKHSGIEERCPVQIDDTLKEKLQEIKHIFEKRKTNYEIVLTPLYDQKKLNAKDIEVLLQIFGKDHVRDFSGINEITDNKYNYYEWSHFRPFVGKKIMNQIYKK